MGKLSKRFNRKARKQFEDRSKSSHKQANELKVDVETEQAEEYKLREDDSNALVISGGKKRQEKKVEVIQKAKKLLSKKQRKKLQRVVEQKKKKAKVVLKTTVFITNDHAIECFIQSSNHAFLDVFS